MPALRSRGDDALPVIVVGSEDSDLAELRAFQEGSDDYVRKPLGYALLLAPGPGLLCAVRGAASSERRIGALPIDQLKRRMTVAEQPVHVSRMEFEFLTRLATEPTRAYMKQELLREVWGFKAIGSTRRKASALRPTPGRSTPTSAGCARSSPCPARIWFTTAAGSAIGSRSDRCARAAKPLRPAR